MTLTEKIREVRQQVTNLSGVLAGIKVLLFGDEPTQTQDISKASKANQEPTPHGMTSQCLEIIDAATRDAMRIQGHIGK